MNVFRDACWLAIFSIAAFRLDAFAQEASTANETANSQTGTKWALIICGIPGDREHHQLYSETIESLHDSLTTRLGFPADQIRIQFGADPTDEDGPAVSTARGKATHNELQAECDDLREQLQPAESLWVFVLGHAHFDGQRSYLNLPGAGEGQTDIHADEFAKLFENVPAKQQMFFITTPVSGYFIRPLSANGRIVVSATEADREVNETLFPLALADVLAEPPEKDELDADGDGKISLFDLYIAVARNVARRYSAEMLLSTEHAQLDDNGDGRGTELQLDYLAQEEGGRATAGADAPTIRPNSDGYRAQRTILPVAFLSNPTETPDSPSADEPDL